MALKSIPKLEVSVTDVCYFVQIEFDEMWRANASKVYWCLYKWNSFRPFRRKKSLVFDQSIINCDFHLMHVAHIFFVFCFVCVQCFIACLPFGRNIHAEIVSFPSVFCICNDHDRCLSLSSCRPNVLWMVLVHRIRKENLATNLKTKQATFTWCVHKNPTAKAYKSNMTMYRELNLRVLLSIFWWKSNNFSYFICVFWVRKRTYISMMQTLNKESNTLERNTDCSRTSSSSPSSSLSINFHTHIHTCRRCCCHVTVATFTHVIPFCSGRWEICFALSILLIVCNRRR